MLIGAMPPLERRDVPSRNDQNQVGEWHSRTKTHRRRYCIAERKWALAYCSFVIQQRNFYFK